MDRKKTIIKTSILSIIANIVLAIFKAFIGVMANSVAIISDAVNNLSDALSSIITIIGTKLAGKDPDKNHPYGYGRIEYMSALIVSAIVLYAGITALTESVEKIITPGSVDYSMITLIILTAGIIVKFVLGIYVKRKGKNVNSDSLVASGADAFNDAVLSLSVLASAVIYILFNINIEAYIGVILSIVIIKTGIDMIKDSVDNMLGTRIDSDLSKSIKEEIIKDDDVQGAYDLILNNYGPDTYMGSVHVEVNDDLSVNDVDKISRRITKNIMNKYGVILHTIGIYSINTNGEGKEIREYVKNTVFSHEGIIEFHGFYIDVERKYMSFDVVVDYKIKDKESLKNNIINDIHKKYDDYSINIALDLDISD